VLFWPSGFLEAWGTKAKRATHFQEKRRFLALVPRPPRKPLGPQNHFGIPWRTGPTNGLLGTPHAGVDRHVNKITCQLSDCSLYPGPKRPNTRQNRPKTPGRLRAKTGRKPPHRGRYIRLRAKTGRTPAKNRPKTVLQNRPRTSHNQNLRLRAAMSAVGVDLPPEALEDRPPVTHRPDCLQAPRN
jgi:hypothetical protein